MAETILVLNCGSSSIKFQLFESEKNILSGVAENIGQADVNLRWQTAQNKAQKVLGALDYAATFDHIFPLVSENLPMPLTAIGHRVVHGAQFFSESILIDAEVLKKIEACAILAPLHNPANILGIQCAKAAFPHIPQVAVFDTAFHHTLPPTAFLYGLPKEYYEKYQVRRYGFHGISYQYLIPEAAKRLHLPLEKTALIAAHLGNGASVCAALGGKSVDTSMGFTPLEGLLMGTRSGDLDPGLFEYLTRVMPCSVQEFTTTLNKNSGLLGVSGLSNDMRELKMAADKGNTHAALAIEIFCYRLAKTIAAYMVPLGRLDALIFSGGIGENASFVREKTLNSLKFLGFELDVAANQKNGGESGRITTAKSLSAFVIQTQEELMIARETQKLMENVS